MDKKRTQDSDHEWLSGRYIANRIMVIHKEKDRMRTKLVLRKSPSKKFQAKK